MSSAPTNHEVLLQASEIVFSRPAAANERPFELRVSDLAVRAGEVLAICGPSGSGKSTLVAILAGLLRPRSGEVWLTSQDGPIALYGCPPGQWRRLRAHFGFVHQDPRNTSTIGASSWTSSPIHSAFTTYPALRLHQQQ